MLKVKRPRKKLEETEGEGEEILDPDDPDFEAEFNAACDRAAQAIDDWNPEDSDLRGSHIAARKKRGNRPSAPIPSKVSETVLSGESAAKKRRESGRSPSILRGHPSGELAARIAASETSDGRADAPHSPTRPIFFLRPAGQSEKSDPPDLRRPPNQVDIRVPVVDKGIGYTRARTGTDAHTREAGGVSRPARVCAPCTHT